MRSDSYERIHRASLSLSLSPPPSPFSLRYHHFGTGENWRNRFAHFSRFHKETKKVACIPGPVWSTWERETSRAWEAGRKGTEGGTRSLRQEAKKRESGDRKMSSIRYSSIIALLPLLLLLYVCSTDYCRAESFRLPRFRCIIQFAGGIFIRIVLRNESGRGGEGIYSRAESRLSCGSRG